MGTDEGVGFVTWSRSWRVTWARQGVMILTSLALFLVFAGPVLLALSGGLNSVDLFLANAPFILVLWWVMAGSFDVVFLLIAGIWVDHFVARRGRKHMWWLYPVVRTAATPVIWVPGVLIGPMLVGGQMASWVAGVGYFAGPACSLTLGTAGFFVAGVVRGSFPEEPKSTIAPVPRPLLNLQTGPDLVVPPSPPPQPAVHPESPSSPSSPPRS